MKPNFKSITYSNFNVIYMIMCCKVLPSMYMKYFKILPNVKKKLPLKKVNQNRVCKVWSICSGHIHWDRLVKKTIVVCYKCVPSYCFSHQNKLDQKQRVNLVIGNCIFDVQNCPCLYEQLLRTNIHHRDTAGNWE